MRVLLLTDTLPADSDDLLAKSIAFGAVAEPIGLPQSVAIAAIKQAIVQFPVSVESQVLIVQSNESVALQPNDILCPLTLHLPASLVWKGQAVYQACRDIEGLRDRVQQRLGVLIATGEFWLPIVLTAKGALYAEAICCKDSTYHQPFHLPDLHRQPLYRLAHRLLRELNAPPSVYLLQFGWTDGTIGFDRLFPFPAEAAIASLEVQMPNLFACYWQCLTEQPILDLQILGSTVWRCEALPPEG